jgi:hypothetical protein
MFKRVLIVARNLVLVIIYLLLTLTLPFVQLYKVYYNLNLTINALLVSSIRAAGRVYCRTPKIAFPRLSKELTEAHQAP